MLVCYSWLEDGISNILNFIHVVSYVVVHAEPYTQQAAVIQ